MSGHDSETAVIRHVTVSIVHQQDFAIAPVMRSQLVEAATTGAPHLPVCGVQWVWSASTAVSKQLALPP